VEVSGVSTYIQPGSRGRGVFFVLLIVIGLIALFAFEGTGPRGIEERFSSALGLTYENEVHENGDGGVSLEGNPVIYGIILVILGILCWIIYRNFGV
jgi:hypothetical protein